MVLGPSDWSFTHTAPPPFWGSPSGSILCMVEHVCMLTTRLCSCSEHVCIFNSSFPRPRAVCVHFHQVHWAEFFFILPTSVLVLRPLQRPQLVKILGKSFPSSFRTRPSYAALSALYPLKSNLNYVSFQQTIRVISFFFLSSEPSMMGFLFFFISFLGYHSQTRSKVSYRIYPLEQDGTTEPSAWRYYGYDTQ